MHRLLLTCALASACGATGATPLPSDTAWPGGTYDARRCDAVAIPGCVYGAAPVAALSVCGALQQDGILTIEARADLAPDLLVDGTTSISAPMIIAGDFVGRGSVDARSTQSIAGDFATAGDWIATAPVEVHGDATVLGILNAESTVNVGGKLSTRERKGSGAVRSGSTGAPTRFTSRIECVHAVAPDLEGAVDDAVPSLALARISLPTELWLGCGTYRVSSLFAENTLRIHIAGDTVLIVEGDARIAAATRIELQDGATLRMFIGGALLVDAALEVVNDSDAGGGATELSVVGTLRVAAPMRLSGALRAPSSTVTLDDTLDVRGAMIVGPLRLGSPLVVHEGPVLFCSAPR